MTDEPDAPRAAAEEMDRLTLLDRLNGIYRIPITDGLGSAGGDEPNNPYEFVRNFATPSIHKEAAKEINNLRARLATVTAEVEAMRSRVDAREVIGAVLALDLADARKERDTLRERVRALEEDRDVLMGALRKIADTWCARDGRLFLEQGDDMHTTARAALAQAGSGGRHG